MGWRRDHGLFSGQVKMTTGELAVRSSPERSVRPPARRGNAQTFMRGKVVLLNAFLREMLHRWMFCLTHKNAPTAVVEEQDKLQSLRSVTGLAVIVNDGRIQPRL